MGKKAQIQSITLVGLIANIILSVVKLIIGPTPCPLFPYLLLWRAL